MPFDAVTAGLQVNADLPAPSFRVTNLRAVASGERVRPGGVA